MYVIVPFVTFLVSMFCPFILSVACPITELLYMSVMFAFICTVLPGVPLTVGIVIFVSISSLVILMFLVCVVFWKFVPFMLIMSLYAFPLFQFLGTVYTIVTVPLFTFACPTFVFPNLNVAVMFSRLFVSDFTCALSVIGCPTFPLSVVILSSVK